MAGVQTAVITYNCGREPVKPAVFSTHLAKSLSNASPELIVFALQEIAPVAHSFIGGSLLKPYLDAVHATVDLTARKWGNDRPYKALLSRHVGMTAIVVFARDDVKDRVLELEAGGVGVGWYEMGNKGAVAVAVKLESSEGNRTTEPLEMIFTAAHLAPMEWKLEKRNQDWQDIVRGLVLTPASGGQPARRMGSDAASSLEEEPLLSNSRDVDQEQTQNRTGARGLYCPRRHLIVAGDLNYRTSSMAPRPSSRAMYPRLSEADDSPQHYKNLLPNDQLAQEIKAARTLHGFVEAPIDFAPTYKYSDAARKATGLLEADDDLRPGARRDEALDVDADDDAAKSSPLDWPWSAHRWPSWCDRVLYLSSSSSSSSSMSEGNNSGGGGDGDFKPLKYTSLPLMSTSDHQPVVLHLEIPWSAPTGQLRDRPPFDIDPGWRARRAAARRLEVATGVAAYLGTTWEGNAILTALLVGSLGGWFAVQSMV